MKTFKVLLKFWLFFWLFMAYSCKPAKVSDSTIPLYIGTYTVEGSEGIYLARFDTLTGRLSSPMLAANIYNPSYLTRSPDEKLLFAVGEAGGDHSNLFSYRVDPRSGLLTLVDSISTGGAGSCYVSVVKRGWVALANYSSGNVSFVRYNGEGSFQDLPVTFQHQGSGPDQKRQKEPHAHFISADINHDYVYATDLGADKLFVYRCDDDTVLPVAEVVVAPGSGPRHLSFHPSAKMMALLNELTHTVDVFVPDSLGIFSMQIQSYALLPDSLKKSNWSADIHFSGDGNFLYVSLRGVNRIEALKVNQKNFSLQWVDGVGEGINWPRNFTPDPTGRFLLVANQKGNDVVVFHRNPETGRLSATDNRIAVSMPVCLKF